MKKHLIAAAVAAAVAVPAMAQNVTIYGGVDVGVRSYDQEGQTRVTAESNNAVYTSRIGFRGTEDLGGGLRAVFTLEGGLVNSGSLGGSVGFGREASAGLAGGFGEIRFGKMDVSGAEGVDTFAGNANFGNLTFIPGGTANIRTGSRNAELGSDKDNVVRYTSPVFNGIQIQVGRALNATATSTTKPASGTVNAFSAQYVQGKLGLIAGYEVEDGGASRDQKYTAFGARYDFGVVNVGFVYAEAERTLASNDADFMVLSARAPLANGYALNFSYRDTDAETNTNDTKNYNVGVSKALSKRTTLYGIYSSNNSKTDTNDFKEVILNVVHLF